MQIYSRIINPENRAQVESQLRLLEAAGIRLDPLIDWSLALYAEDEMLATASCFRYTLRSIAVAAEHQGTGLMARLITAMEKEAMRRSLDRLMLIAQPSDRKLFSSTGFTAVATTKRGVSIMENSSNSFPSFLKKLEANMDKLSRNKTKTVQRAAIVMNANPFSKGHRFLVEEALRECDQLLILVLSDDPENGFPFEQRIEMVRRGCEDLPQVLVSATGPYAVSTASFPSYYYPPVEVDKNSQQLNDEAELDAALFTRIGEHLKISKRFVGSEPNSAITNFYNHVLSRELANSGIELKIIERLSQNGKAISASRVRKYLEKEISSAAKMLVPATTWDYLTTHHPAYKAAETEN